jgi:hypothetical protein
MKRKMQNIIYLIVVGNLFHSTIQLIRLICEEDIRIDSADKLKTCEFFKHMDFGALRMDGAYQVPWKPSLRSGLDTAHFDDFNNPDDMKIYGDIKKRHFDSTETQQPVPHSMFVGFTFKHQ